MSSISAENSPAISETHSTSASLPNPHRLAHTSDAFLPAEPTTFEETGLALAEIESLILKQLLTSGSCVGRRIADQIKLPFGILQEALRSLKSQMLLNYKGQATVGDFEYDLTDEGEKRARFYLERCTYCGAAPVPLKDYITSIEQQSVRKSKPKLPDLCAAFGDLSLPPAMISQIGQAIHGGKGMFLFGQPGNGKTSIAERVIRSVGQYVWIPRTVTITGEIIRLFDPANHEEAPPTASGALLDLMHYDRRWVRIKRPSIIVGGELRMEQLEVAFNPATGILESPVQLKANCGALVVDDFGRQRMSTAELLNRWIVPLEKGYDYLSLPSGRQVQVPFDQLLVFSTNLPPERLVDEAFLRRIPYKIEVTDPTPRDFRDLMKTCCHKAGIEFRDDAFDHLLAKHYIESGRPLRYCQPRDLVQQVRTFCEFHDLPLVLSTKAFDVAVKNYFAGLSEHKPAASMN
ncbi:AAA family ATPase [Anatilimnocola sp. NA78]|uniref:AAA family ATPase n=1 Tax=Anatilimnocola sp. NA78 TaxID=3415683 RepID=UPI003CE57176